MKILLLEPYYGGSHKAFVDGLVTHASCEIIPLTLPARNWKWRMRLAAPFFADKITAMWQDDRFHAICCSSYVDVATLRSLLPAAIRKLPLYTYFHENQFAYPVRQEDERDFHFGLTNLTSALASDRVAFNTGYNFKTFLQGVAQIQKICQDMKLQGVEENIASRTTILNPGIDFGVIDRARLSRTQHGGVPVIVWNHRWEHDKNPRLFFKTLLDLDAKGIDFRLIILGQTFRRKPAVFSEARKKLHHKIIHYGFVESREEYARLLTAGDLVVSTAQHEFYGIAVIEGVRAGCYPLLPARLSYPELFAAEYLYADEEFEDRLRLLLECKTRLEESKAIAMTERFSWESLTRSYSNWFTASAG